MPTPPQLYADLDRAIPAGREEFETWLRDLVEIPTVSMDPAHADDIQRGAKRAAEILRACGAEAELVETPGHRFSGQYLSDTVRRENRAAYPRPVQRQARHRHAGL